jgi:hypothetical protein
MFRTVVTGNSCMNRSPFVLLTKGEARRKGGREKISRTAKMVA